MINISRHRPIFNAEIFGDRRVDVIGVGATGSRIVLGLAKLGLENIHVWDPDTVDAVNVGNQAYGQHCVGPLKVEALRDMVHMHTGTELTIHPEAADGTQIFGSVVFLLTDKMSSRKTIWAGSLRFKPAVKWVIETRMGVNQGRVYSINPNKPRHVASWEATLCNDGVAEVSACGSPMSVGPIAETVSGLAQCQFIKWFNYFENPGHGEALNDEPDNEVILSLEPMVLISRKF